MNYIRRNRAFFQGMIAIGLPIAIQNLLTTSISIVDTFMVSTQGESSLAAVGLCSQFNSLLFSFYWGFASAGTLFFAQYWGAKNEDGITSAYGVTLSFMSMVGVIFSALALFAPEFILGIYTDNPELRLIGASYLRILGFSFPAQVVTMALSCLLRSTENVKLPLLGSIASMVTNTFLNWVLIYGHLGAPALGVRGAAIASAAAVYVNLAVLYIYGFRDPHSLIMRFKKHFVWTKALFREYLAKASPMIFNEVMYGVGQMLINIVLGHQSAAGIAAMALFRVIEGMVFSFFIGLANASSVMVGKQVGAGELDHAYADAKRFAWICPLITLAICLVILPISPLVLNTFSLSDQARGYVFSMLMIYCVAGPVRTCNYIMNNTYRAGGEPVIGMAFEIGSLFVISVPLVFLSGMALHLPYLMVFGSMYIEEFVKLGIGVKYLRSARWIKPVTEEGKQNLAPFLQRHRLAPRRAE